MNAFRYDNPIMNIMVRIANLMILSFFWLVCSVPLLTLLPASAALYHTMIRVVHRQGNGVAKDFFHAFAGSLRKGLPLSMIFIAVGGLLAYSLYIGHQMMERSLAGIFYFYFGVVLAFLLIAGVLHIIPALATFEGGVSMYIRLGLYFSSRNLLKTLLRLALLVVIALMVEFYPILLLLLPGVYMDLISAGFKKMTDQFMKENGIAEDEEETEGTDTPEEETGTAMPSLELDRQLSGAEEDRHE